MQLQINHRTVYTYDAPIYPEPHYLYLHPQKQDYFHIDKLDLSIEPHFSGFAIRRDLENNEHFQVWFNEEISRLEFVINLSIETHDFNPFHFIIDKADEQQNDPILMAYERTSYPFSKPLLDWVNEIFISKSGSQINFLLDLNAQIHAEFAHVFSHDPNILEPNNCFDAKEGSCRDLSFLLMYLIRSKNIAARYVSGYAYNAELTEGHELHAWVEAFLPGAGWLSLDPSLGLLSDASYIPLAYSWNPANTLPVRGSYRGSAKSKLETYVEIKES